LPIPLAMLEFLARRPDGGATVDEFLHELEAIRRGTSSGRLSELGQIDALEAGLVVQDDDGLRITAAGRSILEELDISSYSAPNTGDAKHGRSNDASDELVDSEVRQKIFGLGLRGADDFTGDEPIEEELESEQIIPPVSEAPPAVNADVAAEPPVAIDADLVQAAGKPGDQRRDTSLPSFLAPAISLPHREAVERRRLTSASTRSDVVSKLSRLGGILRGHIKQEPPNIRPGTRGSAVGGLVLSVLVLLVIIICAGSYLAITQIKSLTSEILSLQKEVASFKQRTEAKSVEKNPTPIGPATDKRGNSARNDQAAQTLALSPDEIQLVREYIKPAPASRASSQPINVGDPVTSGTIPLPSAITDKIPKLLGARFTIRAGSIVIVRRDSKQANAVLGPN
jgi:hypothetical protein